MHGESNIKSILILTSRLPLGLFSNISFRYFHHTGYIILVKSGSAGGCIEQGVKRGKGNLEIQEKC
jgi:hypothetical protein